MLVRETNYFGERATYSARVQATTHLGRHLGMYGDPEKHEGDVMINVFTRFVHSKDDKRKVDANYIVHDDE